MFPPPADILTFYGDIRNLPTGELGDIYSFDKIPRFNRNTSSACFANSLECVTTTTHLFI